MLMFMATWPKNCRQQWRLSGHIANVLARIYSGVLLTVAYPTLPNRHDSIGTRYTRDLCSTFLGLDPVKRRRAGQIFRQEASVCVRVCWGLGCVVLALISTAFTFVTPSLPYHPPQPPSTNSNHGGQRQPRDASHSQVHPQPSAGP